MFDTPLTPFEQTALLLSLKIALWATLASLPLGLAAAWLLARREFWGRGLLDGLIHLPLVIPPVAVGYLLLVLLGRRGLIGAWLYDSFGVSIAFTWKGAVVAAAVMAFPLMVRSMRLSMEAVDRRLETAARTLGASPLRVFITITLPLTAPGILTGAVLAFVRALGEFGATITFVSSIPGQTQTLPLALYSLLQMPDGIAASARVLVLSLALAVAALIASEMVARRIARRVGLGEKQ